MPPAWHLAGRLALGLMLIAFSVTPFGAGEGVGEIVAEAVRVVGTQLNGLAPGRVSRIASPGSR